MPARPAASAPEKRRQNAGSREAEARLLFAES
jgi:hypothetical protein